MENDETYVQINSQHRQPDNGLDELRAESACDQSQHDAPPEPIQDRLLRQAGSNQAAAQPGQTLHGHGVGQGVQRQGAAYKPNLNSKPKPRLRQWPAVASLHE